MTVASQRLLISTTPLRGLARVDRQLHDDARGSFCRLFCADELGAAASATPFVVAQINHSVTARAGTVRGLHFQRPPHAEQKLVSCLRGAVFDVAVDLRRGSPTFLKWHGERLSGANRRGLWIPEGFAHGFQALEDDTELLYLHSRAHAPDAEDGVDPRDPALAIDWPLSFAAFSERDRRHAPLGPAFAGI
jgi:dTDP-4-dehydrorhamnose 3,5-epimerase